MISREQLVAALADRWDEIAAALGAERARVEHALLPLLRALELAGDGGARQVAVAAVLALLQDCAPAYQALLSALREAVPAKGAAGPAGYVAKARWTQFPVFFGTDRASIGRNDGWADFGAEGGELTLGMAEVSVPDDARLGDLEAASWWKLEFRTDPAQHFIVHGLRLLARTEFVATARRLLDSTSKQDVLVFLHGYNTAFADALQTTAQLAYDLQFEGVAALYSWPSEAALAGYSADEKKVRASQSRFVEFIELLRGELAAKAVHVVAHSMGGQLLLAALKEWSSQGPMAAPELAEVVFAAPDVDAQEFKDCAAASSDLVSRLTLYASSTDRALQASRLRHRRPRAGETGVDLVVASTVDTIDASEVDTSLLGHAYYAENRSLIGDLFYLIRYRMPPQHRFGLQPKDRYGQRYWAFRRS